MLGRALILAKFVSKKRRANCVASFEPLWPAVDVPFRDRPHLRPCGNEQSTTLLTDCGEASSLE